MPDLYKIIRNGASMAIPLPLGGSSSLSFVESIQSATSASSSAYAAKGNILQATEDLLLHGCITYFVASESVKLVLVKVDSSNVITEVVESTASITTVANTQNKFKFSAPRSISSGQRFALILVRTGGTSTDVCDTGATSTAGFSGWGFTFVGGARYATLNPAINDSILYSTDVSFYMTLIYEVYLSQ